MEESNEFRNDIYLRRRHLPSTGRMSRTGYRKSLADKYSYKKYKKNILRCIEELNVSKNTVMIPFQNCHNIVIEAKKSTDNILRQSSSDRQLMGIPRELHSWAYSAKDVHKHSQSPPMSQPHESSTHLYPKKKKKKPFSWISKIIFLFMKIPSRQWALGRRESSAYLLLYVIFNRHFGVTLFKKVRFQQTALHHWPNFALRM